MKANFSQRNLARCESPEGFNHKLDSWTMADWLCAVLGELGEAANVEKKLKRIEQGIRGNKETETAESLRQKLGNELADAHIYLNLAMQRAGFNPEYLVECVFEQKSKQIGYPSP